LSLSQEDVLIQIPHSTSMSANEFGIHYLLVSMNRSNLLLSDVI